MICSRFVYPAYVSMLTLAVSVGLTGCSMTSSPQHPHLETSAVLAEAPLPIIVAETSGLVCLPDGSFLTLNDSGNAASVFQLNNRGEVLRQFKIDAVNHDWEALTIHQQKLWIGDIGNNSGVRSGGDLYQTSLQMTPDRLNTPNKTSFVYPDLPKPPLQMYQHDFDAEAIVSANGQLFLFNKAWQSQHSTVYQLTTTAGNTQAQKIATIDGLPGVITGGAFSHARQLYVLTGYARFRENVLNLALYDDYRPFLAVLDTQFKLHKTLSLAQGGQIEAICIDEQQHIWLTQEKSKRRPALLWRWGAVGQLIP